MRHRYALDKLRSATDLINKKKGDLRQRLWDAYMEFHTLSESDFPDSLREDWNYIHNSLTTEPPTYNNEGEVIVGKVKNTLSKMDSKAHRQIAERILDLHANLKYAQ